MKTEKEVLNIENKPGYCLVILKRNGKLVSKKIVKVKE